MQTIIDLNDAIAGYPIWIVCTGTSLKGFPLERLERYFTIGVNDAILFFEPTIHIFNDMKCALRYTDTDAWRRRDPWRAYGNNAPCPRRDDWRYADWQMVATRRRNIKHLLREPTGERLDLYAWEHAGPDINFQVAQLYCRCTVAAAAFQLAVRMGATWIGILGADCYRVGDRARYFWQDFDEAAPLQFQGTDGSGGNYAADWNTMREWQLKVAPDVTVINFSPRSFCTVFDKADWRNIRWPKEAMACSSQDSSSAAS